MHISFRYLIGAIALVFLAHFAVQAVTKPLPDMLGASLEVTSSGVKVSALLLAVRIAVNVER